MHEVLVNRLGGLSLPRKSVVRLTDRPDMTLDVYRGRKTTTQQQQQQLSFLVPDSKKFIIVASKEKLEFARANADYFDLVVKPASSVERPSLTVGAREYQTFSPEVIIIISCSAQLEHEFFPAHKF